MDTIIRHWHILRQITRHPNRIDVGTIHQRLEQIEPALNVSRRTLERDLHLLSNSFPLERDGCRPQGWCWRKDAEGLDVPGMDLTTALTFRMAEEYLSRLLPHSCFKSLTPHMKRAKTLLASLDPEGLAGWPKKVSVVSRHQPLLAPDVKHDVIELVYTALLANRRFKAVYRPQGGAAKTYEISPLGLIINDPVIYLVATCWEYSDLRLMALHRFEDVAVLEKPANRPENFDLQEYIDSGALGVCRQPGRELKFRALFSQKAGASLRESRLCEDQILTEVADGRLLVQAHLADTEQLRWWILGFGSQVEVLEPLELREEILSIISETAKLYGGVKADSGSIDSHRTVQAQDLGPKV